MQLILILPSAPGRVTELCWMYRPFEDWRMGKEEPEFGNIILHVFPMEREVHEF